MISNEGGFGLLVESAGLVALGVGPVVVFMFGMNV